MRYLLAIEAVNGLEIHFKYLVGLILTEATRMLCRQGMIFGIITGQIMHIVNRNGNQNEMKRIVVW